MTREELLRSHFNRDMRLLELGPSHSPIVPKADGWTTTVIDHADQADLVAKYTAMKVATVDRIEPVDYVWQTGSLAEVLPPTTHRTFDGLIASHVGEHFPDLIAFFKDASALLKSDGLMALALPDKRVCFDFFQPLTTTGDLLDAHVRGRTRHQRRIFFNQTAYFTTRDNEGGWLHDGSTAPFRLVNSIFDAQGAYDSATEDETLPYRDTHAWAFTPKSFELLVLELNLLGHIDWSIRAIEPTSGVEFLVWLEQRRIVMADAETNAARLSLLTAIVYENASPIAQLDAAKPARISGDLAAEKASSTATASWPAPVPSIAVIIALYNGSRYIEEALSSVLRQSPPPAEIIVVNDGSTDDGAGVAIVEQLAKAHPIILLHKDNGGQSSARNLGVRESKSELIAFLDQDDVWYDNHLSKLVRPFQTWSLRPLGWVYSNLDEINEAGSLVCHDFLNTLSTTHPKRRLQDYIGEDMFILPSASLIRRTAFEAVGGFDERLSGYEDDDLFLRLFQAGFDNIYFREALSKWRIHSASSSYSFRMARSRAIYTRKLLEMFPDDAKRGRFYERDIIGPRFFDHAVREYESATKLGNETEIEAAWAEVMFLAKRDSRMAPRLFNHSLINYKNALIKGDNARIEAAWSEVAQVAAHMPAKGLRVRATLSLLRNPSVSKAAFAMRRVAKPAMRWAFSA